MKTKFFLLFILFSFVSCSDDDNEVPPIVNSGSFTHNGETYSVNRGYIIPVYTGNDPEYNLYKRRFYIGFSDGQITWADNQFVCGDDVHQWIDFSLYTSALSQGTMNTSFNYPLHESPNYNLAYIDNSNVITDIVVEDGQTVEFINHDGTAMIATGDIQITSFGGLYSISYSFVDNHGDTVTGSYFGTLTVLHNHGS